MTCKIIARNASRSTWKRVSAEERSSAFRVARGEPSADTFIDWLIVVKEHGTSMLDTAATKIRRSARVFMRVRVVVAGKNSDGRRFREACETVVINAHGGLMYLNQPLHKDAELVITHPFTQDE